MLAALRAILLALMAQGRSEILSERIFSARVLAVSGETAWLLAGSKRFPVRLAVSAEVGERLLLEKLELRDGLLYCRVLQRQAAAEAAGLHNSDREAPPLFSVLLYPEEGAATPYFLVARREEDSNLAMRGDEHRWLFLLRTANLGLVALLVSKTAEGYDYSLLTETEKAMSALKPLGEGLRLKVMNVAERERFLTLGSTVDLSA